MNSWNKIKTQTDIEELMNFYSDFHDSCIVSVHYHSGACVDRDGAMCFGYAPNHILSILFQRQFQRQCKESRTIELCFTGVRQVHLTGWQNYYDNAISGAHIAFYDRLFPGSTEQVIVWANRGGFDVKNICNEIKEPSDTYVIADSLKWRIIEDEELYEPDRSNDNSD